MMGRDYSRAREWVRCPECGKDDFDTNPIPDATPGYNTDFECPECGHTGRVVG